MVGPLGEIWPCTKRERRKKLSLEKGSRSEKGGGPSAAQFDSIETSSSPFSSHVPSSIHPLSMANPPRGNCRPLFLFLSPLPFFLPSTNSLVTINLYLLSLSEFPQVASPPPSTTTLFLPATLQGPEKPSSSSSHIFGTKVAPSGEF